MGTNEKVVVKLTERGQKSYKTKLYSRPAKEPESSGDTYVFYCSPLQAYNYFFLSAKKQRLSNKQAFARDLKIAITTVLIDTGRKYIRTYSDAFIATDYVLIAILDDIEHSKTLGVLGAKACLI